LMCFLSMPVSRVLSWTTICLDRLLPAGSSHLPGTCGPQSRPSAVLLQAGFAEPDRRRSAGELLPHLSILAGMNRRFISVALSLKSPSPGITRRLALWSPDFPHARPFGLRPRLSGMLRKPFYYNPCPWPRQTVFSGAFLTAFPPRGEGRLFR
jgi:hypothetical protein